MINYRKISNCLLMIFFLQACKDKYEPALSNPETGYLVLEGYINSGIGATEIKLSRTGKLEDTARIDFENNAVVSVEGDNNSSYPLYPSGPGRYSTSDLQLDAAHLYRIHIFTQNGREYVSDYSRVVKTPPVAAIPWRREADGIHIGLEAVDPTNSTRYYTWEYSETWEIYSDFVPSLQFTYDQYNMINGVEYINPDSTYDWSKQHCWNSENSTKLLTASTVKLSSDLLKQDLLVIENKSLKLDVRYSILVSMHGCTPAGFDFLQRMLKNTEEMGSVFDAQPSELNSNLHSVTDPAEPVVGFVEIADLSQRRIFLTKADVGGWDYSLICEQKEVSNNPASLQENFAMIPLYYGQDTKISVQMVVDACADCTILGSTIRPDFW